MNISSFEYFLSVIRAGNISKAARELHISQPALSRRIASLEDEVGAKLFARGSRRAELTEEGQIFRKRAEEMMELLSLTRREIRQAKENVLGEIRIGAGESKAFEYISKAACRMLEKYPGVKIHVVSGDTLDLTELLDRGLIDVALLFSDIDSEMYDMITLPSEDRFVALMRKDSPLARKDIIGSADLAGHPLILSRAAQGRIRSEKGFGDLDVVATYNLAYNASIMVKDGAGTALVFDGLINVSGNSELCTRPMEKDIEAKGTLVWKKYRTMPTQVRLFLDEIRAEE